MTTQAPPIRTIDQDWTLHESEVDGQSAIIDTKLFAKPGGEIVAGGNVCIIPQRTAEECNEVGRLIVNARGMLDMLKTIENDAGQVPAWLWNRIQETIANAEGRPK